jgi:hypothetical protein
MNPRDPRAVFIHYLQQLIVIVDKINAHTQGDNRLLAHSLHADMLPLLAQLRSAGVPLSKGDYDGYHQYPSGFSFVAAP